MPCLFRSGPYFGIALRDPLAGAGQTLALGVLEVGPPVSGGVLRDLLDREAAHEVVDVLNERTSIIYMFGATIRSERVGQQSTGTGTKMDTRCSAYRAAWTARCKKCLEMAMSKWRYRQPVPSRRRPTATCPVGDPDDVHVDVNDDVHDDVNDDVHG